MDSSSGKYHPNISNKFSFPYSVLEFRYWPIIDDALRKAAFDRHVTVKLLVSYWDHTWDEMFAYLWSLQELNYHSKYLHIDVQVVSNVLPSCIFFLRGVTGIAKPGSPVGNV